MRTTTTTTKMGKWGKWKRRFRVVLAFALALVFVFVFAFISISLGACFHFGFTFDLTVSFGLAQFVYLASFLHSTILRSARQKAHKYLCGAKTMRMPRRNSTAHLQMNRLMSAGHGGRDVSPLSPSLLSIRLALFMWQSSGNAQIDFKHVNLNLLLLRGRTFVGVGGRGW